jgi:hypothetical protein
MSEAMSRQGVWVLLEMINMCLAEDMAKMSQEQVWHRAIEEKKYLI